MKRLKGKVLLIFGAGSDMGNELAVLYAREGCKVVAIDINYDRSKQLQNDISAFEGDISTLISHFGKFEDIDSMVDFAVENYETLDILVKNKDITDNFESAGEVSDFNLQNMLRIYVDGPLKSIRKALPILLNDKKGCIINIASF